METINSDIVKFEILTLAKEDISGLYEIVWRLNTLYPNISEADKISITQPIIKSLLAEKLIQLYKRNWYSNMEELIPSNWNSIIDNPLNWEKPNDSGDYFAFFSNLT